MNIVFRVARIGMTLALLAAVGGACAQPAVDDQRDNMLKQIREGSPAIVNETVLEAVERVPRHEFVPDHLRALAYENRPLPIGEGQTISQPYIVALMTDLADVNDASTVLEVGTGSGYQAAVLAQIVDHVYTVEIVDVLAKRARSTLERLGYDNVTVRAGDGYHGWREHAPFDAIVVTAAPATIPEPLLEQLAVGGKLVIPVGPEGRTQILKVVTRLSDEEYDTRSVTAVIFVPFTRDDDSGR